MTLYPPYGNDEQWIEIIETSPNFFDEKAMRFFNSRILWNTLTKAGNAWVFVTSERFETDPRKYSIRLWEDGNLETIDEFQEYLTAASAKRKVAKIAQYLNELELA